MFPQGSSLIGSYDYRLVVLSVVISCIASYAALDLGGRVTSARGWARPLWLSGGATAMGIGIWSMHYIGMLAFHLPVPVLYDWPTVLLSLLAAIVASGIALFVVSQPRLGLSHAVLGSIFMGVGIATMHYTGMAAMRLAAMHHYSLPIVTLSVVLAIGISFVALWLTFHLRGDIPPWGWKKVVSSLVMGAAIPVMHYTGMAAASFEPAPLNAADLAHAVPVSSLGMTGIVAATLMVLALVLLTSMADREFSAQIKVREQAETALVDSERTYDATFDEAPIGIAQVAPTGEWLRVNRALCHLLGLTEDQVKARTISALVHPDDRQRSEAARARLMAGELDQDVFQIRFRGRHDHYIWASVTMNANRDVAGRRVHLVIIVEDITERRLLEEQVRQSQKMEAIGQLAAGVAHDFNNLLTVIIGFNELAVERLEPAHPCRSDLNHALAAGRSAASVTRQLLAFGRKQLLRPESLDLNSVVSRMEMLLRRTIGEQVRIEFRLAPIGIVSADPGQLEQVLLNLAVNARDAMPGGGTITIETANVDLDDAYAATHLGASAGPHVKIALRDTGVGMSEQVRARLFEPFFTTKERGKGTGLGLATVYGIVKQSGGSIWVDSEPGRGSTFNVYLPRTTQTAADLAGPSHAAQPPARGTETILIAEDQPEVGSLMRATLDRHGYAVIEARGGAEALRFARDFPAVIHLLLTDVVMPGMTGRELAHRLVQERPQARVLYTSGYTDSAIVQHGVIDPGLAFIQKPFSPDDLLRKIRDVLDR